MFLLARDGDSSFIGLNKWSDFWQNEENVRNMSEQNNQNKLEKTMRDQSRTSSTVSRQASFTGKVI
jgi:hypothetical protein